ncbi:MAG: glycoside hydrolase family 97 N-terminal domain-containing protein, partial [Prolixibacteraceae bacterium]|nr:glycoside hydrolase family 97 N-terminal domain-containing protein [Prolixibacteraceae bacterium]
MKKISSLFFVLFLIIGFVKAEDKKLVSPDGKLVVAVSANSGAPTYSVTYNDKLFLKESPLGLKTNVGDFSQGLTLNEKVSERKVDETYELPNIKQSKVHYMASEGVFSFLKENQPALDVVFRVSNNDVAFQYKVYPQKERLSCRVNEETSGFVFPEGTTTFLTAQSKAMVGFARTMPSYEIPYNVDAPMGENGQGNGYTFPCLFKVNGLGWVLISETGVDSRYCGSRLIGRTGGLYSIGFPMEDENNGNGTAAPGLALPGATPWRKITVGETLTPIVETTVSF